MSIRRRLRSVVHRLALGTLGGLIEGLEDLENTVEGWFHPPAVDTEEDLALDPIADELDDGLDGDPDLDEKLVEQTEAYLDALEEIEGDIDQLDMELDADIGEAGTVLPFRTVSQIPELDQICPPRPTASEIVDRTFLIPFVDAKTRLPVLMLEGKKKKFGPTIEAVIGGDKIPVGTRLVVKGIQTTIHGWDGEERREEAVGVELYATNLRMDGPKSLFPLPGWVLLDSSLPIEVEGPTMKHIDDQDRVKIDVALGPIGTKRTDKLFCTVSLIVRLEIDTRVNVACGVVGR